MTLRAFALLGLGLLVACPRPSSSDDDDTPDPNFDAGFLPQGPQPPHAPMQAELLEIYDGDTGRFRLDDGDVRSVRFLSIDTPEMNATSGDPPECYAPEATDRAEELLPVGTSVWLTWDGEYQDAFDRLLCYIFVGETPDVTTYDSWVNYRLVREGYAVAYIFSNNQTYRDVFEGAEAEARSDNVGRWDECGF